MESVDILIIGGSAAGITSALEAKRKYPDKKVTLVRKEEKVLIPCALPYLFKTVGSLEKDLIPDDLLLNKGIKIIEDEIVEIDRESKKVKGKENEIEYDKLILATGSFPSIPPISGVELKNVFSFKKDASYLSHLLESLKKFKSIVIIGGGFIGVELADELSNLGKEITIIEMLPHCLEIAFDDEFCEKIEDELKKEGISIITNVLAERIEGKERVENVKLKDGREIKADAVILAIGTKPDIKLAETSGLKIGETKAVWVDEYQRTSDTNIYAVGDCAEKRSFFTKKPVRLMLASIATREARIATSNLFELREKNEGVVGTFLTIVNQTVFGVSGIVEKEAKRMGIKYKKGSAKTVDKHPSCMPFSKESYLKLLFNEEDELIGGEFYGSITLAYLINLISSLIERKVKRKSLMKLQLASHPKLTPSPIFPLLVKASQL